MAERTGKKAYTPQLTAEASHKLWQIAQWTGVKMTVALDRIISEVFELESFRQREMTEHDMGPKS